MRSNICSSFIRAYKGKECRLMTNNSSAFSICMATLEHYTKKFAWIYSAYNAGCVAVSTK